MEIRNAALQNFCACQGFQTSVKIALPFFVFPISLVLFAQSAPVLAQTQAQPMPDLTVDSKSIRLREGEDKIGDDAHLEATIRNIGNAPTGREVLIGIRFFVNGEVVAWSATLQTALQPGQLAVIRTNSGPDKKGTWKVVAGTHTVRALVDDVNRVPESNEDNNTAETVITK